MNKEWSQKNKEIQVLLGKELTYKEGIQKLISFREELFEQISNIVSNYPKEAFYQMPFKNAKGYHSKTLAYSIWHIFRIEDIVAHELIKNVMETSNAFLSELSYDDIKQRFTDVDKNKIADSKCVSTDENAVWLIDYWCSKDVRGLLKMPFVFWKQTREVCDKNGVGKFVPYTICTNQTLLLTIQ